MATSSFIERTELEHYSSCPLHAQIAKEVKRSAYDSFTLGDVAAEVEFIAPPPDMESREMDDEGDGMTSEAEDE